MNGEAAPGGIHGRIYNLGSDVRLTLEPTDPQDATVWLWTHAGGEEHAGKKLAPSEARQLADDLNARADLIEKATAYDIKLRGCDACTYIYDVELRPAEVALLERLVDLADKAGAGGCNPSLHVQAAPSAPPAGASCANCYDLLVDASVARDSYGEWIHQQCPDWTAEQ